MNCWYCGSKLVWIDDFNYDEFHGEGKGIVTLCRCSNEDCGAKAQFSIREDDDNE